MKTVLLLSGGMDSAVLLWHLKAEGHSVLALTADYGQRHRKELEASRRLADHAGVPWKLVDLTGLAAILGVNALTGTVAVPHGHYEDATMRATVVPNRNAVLLMVATGYAIGQGANAVAYAAHAGDHAIYPDCRPAFVNACQGLLGVCHYEPLQLLTPFLLWDKRRIARRGRELGVSLGITWSCYEGGDDPCGKCGACVERSEAMGV